jgi:hypothetical protein
MDEWEDWERWMDRMGYRSPECCSRNLIVEKRFHSNHHKDPRIVQVSELLKNLP